MKLTTIQKKKIMNFYAKIIDGFGLKEQISGYLEEVQFNRLREMLIDLKTREIINNNLPPMTVKGSSKILKKTQNPGQIIIKLDKDDDIDLW